MRIELGAYTKTHLALIPAILICIALLLHPLQARSAEPATVSFSLDFPHSDPDHYSISVTSDGHAKYECTAKFSQESEDRDNYVFEFEFSPANRALAFDLAAQAKYFAGNVDSGNKKLAFTGAKKLAYRDGTTEHAAEYNYSSVPAVQQLTALFQGISQTMEHGRHLAYYRRYQKLALDAELKSMEAQAKSNDLKELQALTPLLKQIVEDPSIINVVRSRAQRLIELSKAPVPATH